MVGKAIGELEGFETDHVRSVMDSKNEMNGLTGHGHSE